GTMVASLLLHGNVEDAIAPGLPLRPICRVVSARVLDANNEFPMDDLWENDLREAITWCVNQGARIINLSIGDSRSPFSPPRQMSAASVVDALARELGLVVVVAAGNSRPADYLDAISEASVDEYPRALLHDGATGLLDPGTSLLSLTAGGLTDAAASGAHSSHETLRRQPMGKPGWPSPITRKGPGPGQAVKPEVSENAGTLGVEEGVLVSNDAELGVVGASAEAGRLLSWDVGTSYAVPLVSRVAAAVASKFPTFSAELIRSLVLVSTDRLPFADDWEGSESVRLEAERALVGYGRPSIARATESTSHRAILVAEDSIPVNGVHIYEIPVPSSFMSPGGKRGLDIALAYSPPTRIRRLDYMASGMEYHLVKGLPLDEVAEVFARVDEEENDDDEEEEEEVSSISGLGSNLVKLVPTTQTRSRGANQLGRRVFHHKLNASDEPMFLVVRNINRWDDDTARQPYALAVALWRDEGQPELHAQLQALLEAEVELPVEIEIEQ
ncbi:MAG: S8 family peptidase, partial [Acidimicrobiaceae bacterium]|nr:S8 family peptidase [Acidimicrobiaceae bacterium]